MANGTSPPGWYQDPTGLGEARYWNGSSWTQMTSRDGETTNMPIDPSMAQMAPVPGTQRQPPVPPRVEPSSTGSSGGLIIAIVIGLILFVAVLVAVGDESVDDSPAPGDSVPTEQAPPEDDAPAEAPAEEAPADDG